MHRVHRWYTSSIVVGFALVWAGTVAASGMQQDDPRSIVDRIYSVAQAQRGEARFKVSCSSCHTAASFAGGTFAERWNGQTMGEVFDFVSQAMPENDPGGLKAEEYADVLAFILALDAYPVGNDDMPASKDELKKYAIVPNPK
jgi:mono/diheme cytochrome c family protein